MSYIGLIKRWSWMSALITGAFYVFWTTGDFMQKVALGTIETPVGWILLVGGAAVKGLAAAVVGGASADGWSWVKDQVKNGKRDDLNFADVNYIIENHSLNYNIGNVTVYESNTRDAIAGLMGSFYDIIGDEIDNIMTAHALVHVSNDDSNTIVKRDDESNSSVVYSVVYNSTKYLHSAMVTVEGINDAAWDLHDYITGNTTLRKRDGGSYVTYLTYGEDGRYDSIITAQPGVVENGVVNAALGTFSGHTQPCNNDPRCYWVASKGCLSFGDNSRPGVASALVGEFYSNQWGGVDNQCDSG